ncbi:Adaptive-response sensory-kinase SasA [Actinosynnema sp. ALI-1.44]
MTRGRLRVWVTVVATVVVAVPLAAMAVFAAVFLRAEAMRFDNSPAKFSVVCVAGRLTADVVGDIAFGERCEGNGHDTAIPATRIGDVVVPGVADADKVVRCEAHYSSSAEIPELSLWPFTDPDSVAFTHVTDTGDRYPAMATTPLGRLQRASLARAQTTLNERVLLLVGGAAALTGLFGAVVWSATGRVLRPVEAIRREVAHITEHDLTRRVPVPRARTEFARLATTLNATLDRLQAAIEDNRRFVADASHELRSPIAALRAELEIATAHPDLADWRRVVDSALEDTYRLQQLSTDLLLLARLDAPPPAPAEPVDFTAVVRSALPRSDRVQVVADLPDDPLPVAGRPALLARLLGNLLDNALRHAATTVTVRLAREGDRARLDVLDDGPGIPADQREHVFRRFTRLDEARARDDGGTGLGLPIARRIAAAHHGTLVAREHEEGAWFTAHLPLRPRR